MTSSLGNKFDTHRGAALRKLIRPISIVIMASIFLTGVFAQKNRVKAFKKPVSAEQLSEKIALEEARLSSSSDAASAAASRIVAATAVVTRAPVAVSTVEAQVAYEEMFSFPKLVCAADATTRTEVKIRQIIVTPEKLSDKANGAVDHRTAYLQLRQARLALMNETPFEQVLMRYGSRGEANAQPVSRYFKKGTSKAEIERMAFCLPIKEISPIFLTSEGFHLLQVLEAR